LLLLVALVVPHFLTESSCLGHKPTSSSIAKSKDLNCIKWHTKLRDDVMKGSGLDLNSTLKNVNDTTPACPSLNAEELVLVKWSNQPPQFTARRRSAMVTDPTLSSSRLIMGDKTPIFRKHLFSRTMKRESSKLHSNNADVSFWMLERFHGLRTFSNKNGIPCGILDWKSLDCNFTLRAQSS